jgi:hypothetical protein
MDTPIIFPLWSDKESMGNQAIDSLSDSPLVAREGITCHQVSSFYKERI